MARGAFAAAWKSDAIQFRAIAFDTAAWTLGTGSRAIGVRANFSHPGQLTDIDRTTLRLFEARGSTIVPVLSNLLVDQTTESGQCGVYRERHVTLPIAPLAGMTRIV